MGRFCQELLALLAPAMRARHRRVGAGFINKDEPVEVQTGLRCLPELARQSDIRTVLLRRINRFF